MSSHYWTLPAVALAAACLASPISAVDAPAGGSGGSSSGSGGSDQKPPYTVPNLEPRRPREDHRDIYVGGSSKAVLNFEPDAPPGEPRTREFVQEIPVATGIRKGLRTRVVVIQVVLPRAPDLGPEFEYPNTPIDGVIDVVIPSGDRSFLDYPDIKGQPKRWGLYPITEHPDDLPGDTPEIPDGFEGRPGTADKPIKWILLPDYGDPPANTGSGSGTGSGGGGTSNPG